MRIKRWRRSKVFVEQTHSSELSCLSADLPVDHVTHGHSDLHACSLDVVEVEVMEYRQADGAHRQCSCIAQGLIQSLVVIWVVTLKVLNHLPQDDGLDDFNDFLICKERDEGG